MKKLVALAAVMLFSANCMAGHHPRVISVRNNTRGVVRVADIGGKGRDRGEFRKIAPGRSMSLNITVHEKRGGIIPSSIMPHKTWILVKDDEGENKIEIDENTKNVIVNEGLELSTGYDKGHGRRSRERYDEEKPCGRSKKAKKVRFHHHEERDEDEA